MKRPSRRVFGMNVERPKLSPPRVSVSVADSPRLAKVPLRVLSEHDCPFFPDRRATMRGVYALKKYARHYADLLEQGYWRRTDLIEKPVCRDCKACRSVRIPVDSFKRDRAHDRCWRLNRDVTVETVDYASDPESIALFRDYLINRHGWDQKADEGEPLDDLIDWYAKRLGRSPVKCRAFKYRLDGKLIGLSVRRPEGCPLQRVLRLGRRPRPSRAGELQRPIRARVVPRQRQGPLLPRQPDRGVHARGLQALVLPARGQG